MLKVGGQCECGDQNISGCMMREATVMVTGVMRDLPHNTQLAGDVFIPNTSNADPMSQKRKAELVARPAAGAMWSFGRTPIPTW